MENKDYEAKWFIENKVVLFTQYRDEGTLEQVITMITAANALIDSSPNDKIPVLVDVTNIKTSRNNMSAVTREFRYSRSKKWGFTIVIGAEGIVKFFAQVFFQLAGIEIKLAKDMDEAVAILYRLYPDLQHISGE
ncbi:MAG: hypothetical protein SFZ02_09990 [bacterium]|nr:hypothetical protein [bacterium]